MKRFRQFRATSELRDIYSEVPPILADDLIYPYFVNNGNGVRDEIVSLPGVYELSPDTLVKDVGEIRALGLNKILLFGVVPEEAKNETGSAAWDPEGPVPSAIRAVKEKYPEITVIADVCLCGYTSHGHCGLIREVNGKKVIDNDSTLPLLARTAAAYAAAGADFVAPSAMMDGQVAAIRAELDREGLAAGIIGYSAKYASAYYGPFRSAVHSSPAFGDRRTYQMDYRTVRQGIEEIEADIEEGADLVMVKPALAYLDMIERASSKFGSARLVAYQVSGEYAMLKVAAESGCFDEKTIFDESLTAIRRAGARYIISYYAREYLERQEKQK